MDKIDKLWCYLKEKGDENRYKIGNYPWMSLEEYNGNELRKSLDDVIYIENFDVFRDNGIYPNEKKLYYKYVNANSNFAMIYQCRRLKCDVDTSTMVDYICEDVCKVLAQFDINN